ncbi:hypothetical protein AWH56_018495 [Anaerobacillus isosaccharinicus]|uniref:Uncharacterized protein n=1 Tax=Anaerobacillus isosaccharinicus TaxID=1532552 RepID=A0A7S7RA98_9BACI|nr:hypothetical protein [Anaerobacillus isosaccharinicus]MBA5587105.1 hypothetical protein [Anaerobacillus isosaccharinicus]QOY34699.1 hypothetical protein AWH56_018495 [Anaerobacillus isosaccharinicus]
MMTFNSLVAAGIVIILKGKGRDLYEIDNLLFYNEEDVEDYFYRTYIENK